MIKTERSFSFNNTLMDRNICLSIFFLLKIKNIIYNINKFGGIRYGINYW